MSNTGRDRAKILGDNLYRVRLERGLTRREVAEAVGVTENAYGAYERAVREPELDRIFKLADVLDVDVDDLIEESSTGKGKLFDYRLRTAMSFFDTIDGLTNKVRADGSVVVTVPKKIIHKADSPKLILEYRGEYAVIFKDAETFVDAVEKVQLRAVYMDTTFIQAFVEFVVEGKIDTPARAVTVYGD